MENSFKNLVEGAKSLLVLLPTSPHFDQVAAGLSIYVTLKEQGKEIDIVASSDMLVEFNRLVGVNKVGRDLGNKNLVVKFTGYNATEAVEKVSYDIDEASGEAWLAVIPKAGYKPPTKEQVQLTYSGISADTVILIGGANESHFPFLATKDAEGLKLVHIGNRDLQTSEGREIISLASGGSSASEVVAGFLKSSGYPINPDVATNLIMGIEKGSNGFSGKEVTAETFSTFAELLRAGGKRYVEPAVQDAGRLSPRPRMNFAQQIQQQMPQNPQVKPQQNISGEAEGAEVAQEQKNPPQSWLKTPKIYKGTSVS